MSVAIVFDASRYDSAEIELQEKNPLWASMDAVTKLMIVDKEVKWGDLFVTDEEMDEIEIAGAPYLAKYLEYKRLHPDDGIKRDDAGQPLECRYFNNATGCRSGTQCPYQHVKRHISEIPCMHAKTFRGCVPFRGRVCPYKH